MIKAMDFCYISSDKKLKGSGLSKGEVVMVTGLKTVPVKKNDPYVQRILTVVVRVKDDKLQLPGENNDYKAYLVDPRSLTKIEDSSKYTEIINNQYG